MPIDEAPRFLIPDDTESSRAWDSLHEEDTLALDLESDSFHRYYPKVCLIQISSSRDHYLFDPLCHGMPPALRDLLTSSTRTWVLHGAESDVRSLQASFELKLGRICDTSVAAQVLGLKTLGLKALLEAELGLSISKAQQRSDWAQRPLSPAQLFYAQEDTRHLLPLAEALRSKLEAQNRAGWVREECERIRHLVPSTRTFDEHGWRKIKGAKQLQSDGIHVLYGAYLWREDRAQKLDRAPFRVLRNEVLIRLALEVDKTGWGALPSLRRLPFLPRSMDFGGLRRFIERAMASGKATEASRIPKVSTAKLPAPGDKARVQKLRASRALWAERLGLDEGFLLAKPLLERLVRAQPRSLESLRAVDGMGTWRVEVLGPQILEVLVSGS